MSEPQDVQAKPAAGAAAPFGAVGAVADRGADGRFLAGNSAALVVGATSAQFWREQADARREVAQAVIADAGHTERDSPEALRLAADSIAQAALVQRSAFARVVESGGPLTSRGRTRRAFVVWLQASDRLERYLRLVGLRRVPKPAPSARDIIAEYDRRQESQS